jgi:hypothetical protein
MKFRLSAIVVIISGVMAQCVPSANASTISESQITAGPMLGATSSVGGSYYGGSYWNVTGVGSVFELCMEPQLSGNVAASYDVIQGFSWFGSPQADNVEIALLSNAFPILNSAANSYIAENGSLTYNPAYGSDWQTITNLSTALQELTWDYLDQQGSVSTTLVPQPDANDPSAALQYQWANNVNSGAWTPNGNVNIDMALASDGTQDRIWITTSNPSTSPVPEPATLSLFGTGLIGAGGLLRKRFKQA